MVRSIWLAAYFLIGLLALAALKLSLAMAPAPHDASAPAPFLGAAAPTLGADVAEARPLAKSDRLPIAMVEREAVDAITRFAVLDPAPPAVAGAAKPAAAERPAAVDAAGSEKPARTAAGRPWRNAHAEKSAHRSHRHGLWNRKHRHRHGGRARRARSGR